jgi:4-diphosphocytidyl-2-C-methyl-D-erythritol kinase
MYHLFKSMGNLILHAPAKINLSLNVLPQRGRHGYYEVSFINTQVNLSDRLIIEPTDRPGIRLNGSAVDNKENLAYRAATLMMERYGLKGGVTLRIEKRIPLRAGLGGGSADAAAVINGLANHTGLHISPEEKNELAQMLGMDVCYCVVGGLCTVSGVGETVTRLPFPLPQLSLLIATPPVVKPSTGWAYSLLREEELGKSLERYKLLLQSIAQGDTYGIVGNLHNDFELPIERRFPLVASIKATMADEGADAAMLAGSGLSVFGIFSDMGAMQHAMEKLKKSGVQCFMTKTVA